MFKVDNKDTRKTLQLDFKNKKLIFYLIKKVMLKMIIIIIIIIIIITTIMTVIAYLKHVLQKQSGQLQKQRNSA